MSFLRTKHGSQFFPRIVNPLSLHKWHPFHRWALGRPWSPGCLGAQPPPSPAQHVAVAMSVAFSHSKVTLFLPHQMAQVLGGAAAPSLWGTPRPGNHLFTGSRFPERGWVKSRWMPQNESDQISVHFESPHNQGTDPGPVAPAWCRVTWTDRQEPAAARGPDLLSVSWEKALPTHASPTSSANSRAMPSSHRPY